MRVLLLIVAALSLMAQEVRILGPFPAKDGETCIVCNMRVTPQDKAYIIDGKRVAVMAAMEEEFLRDPLRYVTSFRPEGTVLTTQQRALTSNYVWLGVFALIGLMFGSACAHMAAAKGLSKWQWFVLGFWFSVPAVLTLAGRPMAAVAPEAREGPS